MVTGKTVPGRRPGRPRKPGATEAILAAALQILQEEGFAALTIEQISARAGVGRPAIYRRWPAKEAVVEDALSHLAEQLIPLPDTGSLRGDLVQLVEGTMASLATPGGRVVSVLIAEAVREPSYRGMTTTLLRRRREQSLLLIERAKARGELADSADGNLLLDLIGGPVWVRHLLWGDLESGVDVQAIVDAVLAGTGLPAG